MKIVVAPDSFKGTFSAMEVSRAVAAGIRSGGGEAVECPVADGGEGSLDILLASLGGREVVTQVSGPLGVPVHAKWGWFADERLAVTEAAQACGLSFSDLSPEAAVAGSTVGVGELLLAAADVGATRIIVALGGSATTDGGIGALGAVDRGRLPATTRIDILSDVTVPFEEAAVVFGPQKGADPTAVGVLTRRLEEAADSFARNYGRDPRGLSGTGAAGGLAGGLWAALNARILSGADTILDLLRFDEVIQGADAVVVGEGRLDGQSLQGKIVGAIAARCGDIPLLAVAGQIALNPYQRSSLGLQGIWRATNLDQLEAAGSSIAAWVASSQRP